MNRIAELRKEKKLSQIGLALKLNITQYMVSAYETGRNQPSFEMIIQIADFFNVSIDYLLGRTDYRTMITTNKADNFSEDVLILVNNYESLNDIQKRTAQKLISCLKYYK